MHATQPIAALRGLFAGRRLILCALIGASLFLLLPESPRPAERLVIAWVAAAGSFLALTLLAVGDASPERVRARARQQDERMWVTSTLVVAAAGVTLLAVGFLLHRENGGDIWSAIAHILLAGSTVAVSWTLVHTMFALHYAHFYYGEDGGQSADHRGGLEFPGEPAPDYWDFFYFSFVVGMTCQVSDVQVTSRPMRRLALAHGVLSFFFNTVILALAVSFLAGAV